MSEYVKMFLSKLYLKLRLDVYVLLLTGMSNTVRPKLTLEG